ncbi:hypothetical protein M8756_16155 [Lutimaribacter sp. EGI FJ00015]|uniref:Uncharacterized protein n=1 Tax=Lutimaribacter degradans TaxID=2945989 RepID=A0ACC6A263_9RHOB|nr:hypothetical protein [Lutimaribacter sp. EGI FJ00013]MCO0614852.1 hypothetical protein [Lutimaribacter sp. EGI FJ00015]MCO0637521.1 hypothetical protein [Lutimaribacter sp. EGI FJ00014]
MEGRAMGRLFGELVATLSSPDVVGEIIWQAANETGDRLRLRTGQDAHPILEDRKIREDATFTGGLKNLMGS